MAKFQWYEVYVPGTQYQMWIPAVSDTKAIKIAKEQGPEYQKLDWKAKVKIK